MMSNKLFTLTELTSELNLKFKKKTGNKFTVSDAQGYVRRGYLPKYLGDITLKKHKQFKGIVLYELKIK